MTRSAPETRAVLITGAASVAVGTVRAESYGPSKVPLAIVTRSCALDLGSPLFTEGARPLVLTVATAPPERLAAAREVADTLIVEERNVDLRSAVHLLGEAGYRNVLAEGGLASTHS